MITLDNVLTDEGRLSEAGQLLREGIGIEKTALPSDSAYLGKAWHYLGRFQVASGEFTAAQNNFDRAEAIFQRERG